MTSFLKSFQLPFSKVSKADHSSSLSISVYLTILFFISVSSMILDSTQRSSILFMKRIRSSGSEDLNFGASLDPGAGIRFSVSTIFVDDDNSSGFEFDCGVVDVGVVLAIVINRFSVSAVFLLELTSCFSASANCFSASLNQFALSLLVSLDLERRFPSKSGFKEFFVL